MKKIYVFGSLNMDLVITSPREVLRGETIQGSNFRTNPGGKGANQAVACGKLGGQIFMGGCVGEDAFGTALLDSLQKAGVHTEAIRRVSDVSTGVAVITIVQGDNSIILDSGANGKVCEEDMIRLLRDAEEGDYFLCQLENPLPVVKEALCMAKGKGMTTVLNPAPMNKEILSFLEYVDILVPNEHEFYDLTDGASLSAGVEALQKLGVKCVVVTLGKEGYYASIDAQVISAPSMPAKVVDTTAAGDTFCGAMVTRLAVGDTMKDALAFANRASAITVSRPGAQDSIPTIKEMEEKYQGKI